jgi:hypothetical protein
VDGSAPGQTDVLVDGMSAGQVASRPPRFSRSCCLRQSPT